MLSAMQGIPEHSQRGFTNPTVSQLFNSLYFYVFAAMQGTPEHTNRRIANPTVVQFFTCLHASFNTKLKGKKYLLAMWQVSFSRVLQTLQSVSCSFLRILPCFLQYKGFPSIANEALQTLQFSCSFLRILPCFLQCKPFPSIAKEALQPLQSVVHSSVFYYVFCRAKHS